MKPRLASLKDYAAAGFLKVIHSICMPPGNVQRAFLILKTAHMHRNGEDCVGLGKRRADNSPRSINGEPKTLTV